MKRLVSYILCAAILLTATVAVAKTEYIYRKRANWVKIKKADPKYVPLGALKQPYTDVTVDQMEAMLLSIKIAKKYLLKKDLKTLDVFNSWEARKFSPYLVEALAKAEPDQVVHFSIINKRPLFILRNDRLTMGHLWVDGEGIHFQFTKLFAKLTGDYESSASMDKLMRKAKTMRVSLEANKGQKLSYASTTEIILDPNYNFVDQMYQEREQDRLAEEQEMRGSKGSAPQASSGSQATTPGSYSGSSTSGSEGDVAARLRKLENLKKQKLISEKEYQDYRKKILSEI